MSTGAIPAMPIREAPETALVVYTALMLVATLGFLAWWALSGERRRGAALPLLLAGGVIAGAMEPWLDNLVLVGYPPDQNLPSFEAWGRTVPIFVPIGYGWFCGGLLYVVARTFERGVGVGKVWTILGFIAVIDFAAIGLSSWIGILEFFGDPPMSVLGYPLWWAAIDGLAVILGGAVVWVLLDHLRGARTLWYLLVPSIAFGAAAGMVGWPVSIALNSGWSTEAKYACAVASIIIGLTGIHFLSRTLPRLTAVRASSAGSTPSPR